MGVTEQSSKVFHLSFFPQDVMDTESWHDIITLDPMMALDTRNLALSYTEDGFVAT